MEIDHIYTVILRLHTSEIKPSYRDMAKMCKLSLGAIQDRVARLKRDGLLAMGAAPTSPRALALTDKGRNALNTRSRFRFPNPDPHYDSGGFVQ